MAIVSCPDCSKKLKVADTSVGKKVKCTCGNVFVAEESSNGVPAKAAASGDKVVVACTECSAKLKVASTSLGKKMKCPKCAAVFVAAVEDEAPPKPVKKAPPVVAAADDDEEEAEVKPKAKAKKPPADDDDDLLNMMTEDDAGTAPAKKSAAEDEHEEEPKPKAKGKPPRVPAEAGEKPVYPSRLIPNILVAFLLLIFAGLLAAVFLDINLAKMLGLPEAKGVKPKRPPIVPGKKNGESDKEKINKDEIAKFNGAWIVASAQMPGIKLDALLGKKFVFADTKVTTPDPIEAPFTIDATKDPKWIEMPTAAKMDVPGIYAIEADQLKLCTALPKVVVENGKQKFLPGERPTQFDAKQGVLMILKREKTDNNPIEPKKDKIKPAGIDHRQSQNNLKQIGLAMLIFHDHKKRLPPAAICLPADKPLLSWRVAILPFIGEEDLFKQFDRTKPWNDSHNKKLIAKMPQLFVVPGTDGKDGKTHYQAIVGKGTALGPFGHSGRKLTDMTDGTSNTFMIVEAKEGIEWTRPDHISVGDFSPFDKGPIPKFGVAPDGFNVLFADGTPRLISYNVPDEVLRLFLTCSNGTARIIDGKTLVAMPKTKFKPRDSDLEKEPRGKDKDFREKGKDKDFKNKDKEKNLTKAELAIVRFKALLNAVNAYAVNNNGKFPRSPEDLLQKDAKGAGPYLKDPRELVDPLSGKPYAYNPYGPKNGGRQPDIWGVDPDGKMMGNWPTRKGDSTDTRPEIKKTKDKGIDDKNDNGPKKKKVGNSEARLLDIAAKKTVWTAPGAAMMAFSPGAVFIARADKSGVQVMAVEDLASGKK